MVVVAAAKIVFDAAYELFATDAVAWDVARRMSNYITISTFFTTIAVIAATPDIQDLPKYFKANRGFIRWICYIIGMVYLMYAGVEATHVCDERWEYDLLLKNGYKTANFYAIAFCCGLYYFLIKFKKKYHWI